MLDHDAPSEAVLPTAPFGETDETVVIGQLGQTLDGRIATVTGDSRDINCGGGLDYLHGLRAEADAVVVGIGTVLADDPQLTVRRVTGTNPARVIIDPNGRLSPEARCLGSDGAPVLVVTGDGRTAPAPAETIAVADEAGHLPPGAIVEALAKRGYRRLLIEGGPITIGRFIEAGLLDTLHLIVAPVILGSGRPGIALPPISALSAAIRPKVTVQPLASGDVVFQCRLAAERDTKRRPL